MDGNDSESRAIKFIHAKNRLVKMKEKIISYLENELSPSEKIKFEAALQSDTDLRKAFQFQKAQWEKLELLRLNAKAAQFMQEAAAAEARPTAYSIGRLAKWSALAAATLLFVFNYNSFINWCNSSGSSENEPSIVKSTELPGLETKASSPSNPVSISDTQVSKVPAPIEIVAVPKSKTKVSPPQKQPAPTVILPEPPPTVILPEPPPAVVAAPPPTATKDSSIRVGTNDPHLFDDIFIRRPPKDTNAGKIIVDSLPPKTKQ